LEKKGVGRHFFPISTTILFEIETELYYVVNRGYESKFSLLSCRGYYCSTELNFSKKSSIIKEIKFKSSLLLGLFQETLYVVREGHHSRKCCIGFRGSHFI
jgi:hypothetical protein